jgi:phosphoglycolate phosphatase
MALRLLLCDLDGTLVDSLRDIVTSCNLLLASINMAPLAETTIRPLIGRGVEYLVSGLLAEAGANPDQTAHLIARYREIYRAHAMDETRLYPGVRETLAALTMNAHDPLRLAVVSNKPERASRDIIDALEITGFFSVIAGGDTFSEMKPSPFPLQKIAEGMCVPVEESIIIGDSVYDLQAGKAAGMRTIAALYGFQPPEILKALEPDYAVSAFEEILSIIQHAKRGT